MFDPGDPRNELYSRPAYFKVFVSSKMAGGVLVPEREAAVGAVEEFPLARAWAWERDAPAGSYYSKEECVRQAGTSEAIVLIVEDELTDTTRAEYAAAHRAGATAIILLKDGFARLPDVERFIARVRDHAITKSFSNLTELRSAIVDSLWTWTVRAGRTVLLETRESRDRATGEAVYGDLQVAVENGESRYVAAVVEEAREIAASGSPGEALESLYGLADFATRAGLVPVARALLAEIATTVPAAEIDRSWEGWIVNVRGRVESASRHPEAARASFEQMRQIAVSIADPEMEAIAHQNLGVEAWLRDDPEAAREHTLASLKLKHELEDVYGGIEVLLNLAGVLTGHGRLDAAEAVLDDVEPLVIRYRMVDLRSNVEGQRGLIASRRGDLAAAKERFLESLRWARRWGRAPRQITALQNLGKNAVERGKLRDGVRWLRKALGLALKSNDKHQEQIQRVCLGNAFFRLEDWQEGADQFAAAGAIAAELGDASAQAEALGDAASCLRNAGKSEAALGLINEVLADPAAEKDPDWRAQQLRTLAEVLVDLDQSSEAVRRLKESANLATDPREQDAALQRAAQIALEHPGVAHEAPPLLHRALELHRARSSGPEWAWQAATMGAMLSETSQADRAPEFFALALRVFARSGDRRRAFYTRNDRAIALSRTDRLAAAAKDLQRCIEIAASLDDPALAFQAEMNLGEIERQRGRLAQSGRHLDAALLLARARNDLRDEGAATAIQSLLRVDEGREADAEQGFSRTLEIGRGLKDDGLQQSALGGLAGIASRAGRTAEAERRLRQAIRKGAGEPSIALAEDLAACVLAMAARGKSDEEILQQLIDVSGVVGWDPTSAVQLASGAQMLAAAGKGEEAMEMQALAVASALRDLFARISDLDAIENLPTQVLAEVVFRGVWWMSALDDYPRAKVSLLDQVRDSLGSDGGRELVDQSLLTAEEVWAEGSPDWRAGFATQ